MQNLLATYPDIDGVWVQDGMAAGAWRAILTEDRTNIAATGEIRKDFLETWKAKNLNSGASVNPPGCMTSALNVTVYMLLGKEFKKPLSDGKYGNALYIPIPFIDSNNFDQAYKQVQGKPGHYSVSESLNIKEAAAYFK